ncbi:N-acetylglucosamine-6-phosphate deacetylase [Olsenella urininfantis]|uniref:N-acetylglucosamine-6-phosphate deacetylase n=1 Tax=Olsenella urininfantis TaxID=1871033 RepID=UPI000986EC22|nr:N-acetylglucosamine-6-phosphate deacetylase [Olsenella urininfantis]
MAQEQETLYVKSGHIVLPGGVVASGYLPVADGVFRPVTQEAKAGARVLDRSDRWIAPGFVDTHVHGFAGHDVMDCDPEGINAASLELARHGTTSWTPTTLTQSADEIERACASVHEAADSRDEDFLGARIEGIFLEGPFFTCEHAGAQNPDHMCDPSVELFRRWQEAAHGLICRSSIAPEREGSAEYCARMREMGVAVALGHSSASFEEGMAAVAAGANSFVHAYNAMSGLAHRAPGLVGCAMAAGDTFAELICDGMHVHPGAVRALTNAKGWRHISLVSDCLRCGGMPDGDYMLGDFPIRLAEGIARLLREDGGAGNIAGSVLTLAAAVKNVVDWGVASPDQAMRMASEIPARMSGIDDCCGSILAGRCADFNVLSPSMELEETYLGGVLVR